MKSLKYLIMAVFHSCMFYFTSVVLTKVMYDVAYTDMAIFGVAMIALINVILLGHYGIKAVDEFIQPSDKATNYDDFIP